MQTKKVSGFFILEKDEDDQSISRDADGPEDKEENAANVLHEGVVGREGCPVGMGHQQDIIGSIVSLGSACIKQFTNQN